MGVFLSNIKVDIRKQTTQKSPNNTNIAVEAEVKPALICQLQLSFLSSNLEFS